MSENQRIAQEVIHAIGGKENIASFAHCATRLRIMVKDKEKIDQKTVENILEKVKGAFFKLRSISDYLWYGNSESNL